MSKNKNSAGLQKARRLIMASRLFPQQLKNYLLSKIGEFHQIQIKKIIEVLTLESKKLAALEKKQAMQQSSFWEKVSARFRRTAPQAKKLMIQEIEIIDRKEENKRADNLLDALHT